MSYKFRFHRKSRTGCRNCKYRHVKCDESKPRCRDCVRRDEVCSFERPTLRSESPQPGSRRVEQDSSLPLHAVQHLPEAPHYTPKCLLDLRLMHHYSIFAAEALSNTLNEKVLTALKVDIPRLALKHEFLMDAVLLVAMVHLCCMDNSVEHLPLFIYRDQALRALRHAVVDLSSENIPALRGASVLLAAVSFPADRWTNQPGLWVKSWMALALGQRNFRENRTPPKPFHNEGSPTPSEDLYGSFTDLLAPAVIPRTIRRALEMNQRENNVQYNSTMKVVAAELGRLVSILKSPYETDYLEKKVKAWVFDLIPPEFLTYVQQNSPEALVILAHYLALFRFLPDSWIYNGVPRHDISVVIDVIDSEWEELISLPVAVIKMENKEGAKALLATCLD